MILRKKSIIGEGAWIEREILGLPPFKFYIPQGLDKALFYYNNHLTALDKNWKSKRGGFNFWDREESYFSQKEKQMLYDNCFHKDALDGSWKAEWKVSYRLALYNDGVLIKQNQGSGTSGTSHKGEIALQRIHSFNRNKGYKNWILQDRTVRKIDS